jgi:hypothetical protein
MVCQNQSIDDSDAPLARDLRLLVRERLKAGDSDTQIRDFLVARYGDFVLLKPRLPDTRHCCGCCRVLDLAVGGGSAPRAAPAPAKPGRFRPVVRRGGGAACRSAEAGAAVRSRPQPKQLHLNKKIRPSTLPSFNSTDRWL